MIELGVIGLGTIFEVQSKALSMLADQFHIAAVSDIDPKKIEHFRQKILPILPGRQTKIYDNSNALFSDMNIDTVLIAVPPASHFSLAIAGMEHGKHILMEKPAVLSRRELDILYDYAEKHHLLLHIAYHASFAKDLEWYLANRSELKQERIRTIECGFYDPYMESDMIIPGKVPLGGCYIDSGVNALSVCARLLDLSDFTLESKNEKRTESQPRVTYHADYCYGNGSQTIIIHTGWDLGINQKTTVLSFTDSETSILLDHSNQSVFSVDSEKSEILYGYNETERLLTHYLGVFRDYFDAHSKFTPNRVQSLKIHELLLGDR